jgi:hypothetical protein
MGFLLGCAGAVVAGACNAERFHLPRLAGSLVIARGDGSGVRSQSTDRGEGGQEDAA